MENFDLRELQLKQLEILEVIKKICDDNEIKFSLFAGTALGAVRHNGFIPWDDDLDIVMSRNDYIKFKKVCERKLPEQYFYQDYHTDIGFTQCFAKIRDNNTTYIEQGTEKLKMNRGIFVDIFPFDVVPKSYIKRKIQYIYACFNLLLSRGTPSTNDGKLMYIITKILLEIIPDRYHYKLKSICEKQILKYKDDKNGELAELTSTFGLLKKTYPSNLFKNLTEVNFENKKFPVFSDYDKYLSIKFGDYMKLPKEEERICKHKPVICDTNKSYKEYLLN